MRTVTYGAACSLDGFIAAADGGIDWLHFSKDVQEVFSKYWSTVDTVLMGRKTWDASVATAGATGPGGAEGAGSEAGGSDVQGDKSASAASSAAGQAGDEPGPPTDVQTYVFSRTLKRLGQPGAQLVNENAGEFVRQLKRKPGRDICVMGGGEFARSLFEAGVIDEVGLNVHPILLGSGVPLFLDSGQRIQLSLTESRTIDGGCVLSTYRVVPRA